MRFFVQVRANGAEPEMLLFGIGLRVDGEARAGAAARFVPRAEAMRLMARHPHRAVRVPLTGVMIDLPSPWLRTTV